MPELDDIKLSEHFKVYEFCRTTHLEYAEANHDLAMANLIRLGLLADDLEIIRARWAKPVSVNCGVRCEGLNKAVGGSPTSQHTKAEAVDFVMPGSDLWAVFQWIVKESGLNYGQVIYESTDKATWIHYSLGEPFRAADRCRMALVYRYGQYKTFPG